MPRQVSIFLENQPGHLEKVTGVLRQHRINIRAMTLSSSSYGWGILNLLLDHPDQGHQVLTAAGYSAVLRRIVAVRMPDRPGGLHDLLEHLAKAGINIKNAYATLMPKPGSAILVIDAENIDQVEKLIDEAGIKKLSCEEIYQL
ncbi:MAG: ACT domain-containing protein [Deltaproteobacteria bacterium]|nr:ACT domain-containing protein [Deltaproteobacteria bacterium]